MEVEFTPEPSPEERAALLLALGEPERGETGAPAWWTAGVREAVDGDDPVLD